MCSLYMKSSDGCTCLPPPYSSTTVLTHVYLQVKHKRTTRQTHKRNQENNKKGNFSKEIGERG